MKKTWDPSKSPAENMKNMGLLAKPNTFNEGVVPREQSKQNSNSSSATSVIELYDIPDSDTPKRRMPLSDDDQKYICKCLAKHGDDYTAMFRDIKVNIMQHTETKLRKMASRYFLLDPEQRSVEVPEKVKHLVSREMTVDP